MYIRFRRLACGEIVYALAKRDGLQAYEQFEADLLALIDRDFVRETAPSSPTTSGLPVFTANPTAFSPVLTWMKPNAMHESEGWRALESSVTALQRLIAGVGTALTSTQARTLIPVLERCVAHSNRFVRQMAYMALGAIASIADVDLFTTTIAPELAPRIANGTLDGWSEVRFAATGACRQLLQSPHVALDNDTQRSALRSVMLDVLLPPLCVARFDVADGVRLLAQQAWRDTLVILMAHGSQR
jgi:hypothetical protein